MFQLPAVVLSVVIASIGSVLFYIWQGKTLRNLAAYWVASVIGFLGGQWIATSLGSRILVLGQIHLVEGILACAAALLIVKLIRI